METKGWQLKPTSRQLFKIISFIPKPPSLKRKKTEKELTHCLFNLQRKIKQVQTGRNVQRRENRCFFPIKLTNNKPPNYTEVGESSTENK